MKQRQSVIGYVHNYTGQYQMSVCELQLPQYYNQGIQAFIQNFFFKGGGCHCQRGLTASLPIVLEVGSHPLPLEVGPHNLTFSCSKPNL